MRQPTEKEFYAGSGRSEVSKSNQALAGDDSKLDTLAATTAAESAQSTMLESMLLPSILLPPRSSSTVSFYLIPACLSFLICSSSHFTLFRFLHL